MQDGILLDMNIGQTFKANVVYYPENAENWDLRNWLSSNVNVATVDKNGNIKAISCGDTVITCSVEGVSKSLRVTVKPQLKEIIVGNIGTSESADVLEIKRGLNFKLDIHLIPQDDLSQLVITSDDISIVEISGEIIRPINVGKTTITIKNPSGTVTKSFTVVVKDSEVKKPRKKFLGIF